jgi:hypothetical protein
VQRDNLDDEPYCLTQECCQRHCHPDCRATFAAAARRIARRKLKLPKFPLRERRAIPNEVFVLAQHMPNDDRQFARGCDCGDLFASLVFDADEERA